MIDKKRLKSRKKASSTIKDLMNND